MSEWVKLGANAPQRYHDTEVLRVDNVGFRIRDPIDSSDGLYVSKPSVPDLIAWLRKEYPEHFAVASGSCVDVRAKVTLDGLDEIRAASREVAENLERAASAM